MKFIGIVLILVSCSKKVDSPCQLDSKSTQFALIWNQITKQFSSYCNLSLNRTNQNSNQIIPSKISGTIRNLLSTGLVIQLNNETELNIEIGSTNFSFPNLVTNYNVTIKTNPFNLNCIVQNGSGTNLIKDVDNVNIACRFKDLDIVGTTTNFAGSGAVGSSDSTGTLATFQTPYGIVSDGSNLFVADFGNHRIRRIVISTSVVSTIAGSSAGYLNGIGTAAQFNVPGGLSTDYKNLFISDNTNNRVRRLFFQDNLVSIIAGDGTLATVDGIGTSASFRAPDHVLFDGKNLFVSEFQGEAIRKIDLTTNQVTTILTGQTGGITGMAYDGENIYFSNYNAQKIKRFNLATNNLVDILSTGLNQPMGLLLTNSYLYICDRTNGALKRLDIRTNVVTTIASSLNQPIAVTTDGTSLYLTSFGGNRIIRVQ